MTDVSRKNLANVAQKNLANVGKKKSLVNINWKNQDDNGKKNLWSTLAKNSHENNPNQHHLKQILADIGEK